jgi:hypothetical protein
MPVLMRLINGGNNEMTTLYIYNLETDEHVATITGKTIEACMSVANDRYGYNDYYWDCSPVFGLDALDDNPDAEQIDADLDAIINEEE